MITLTYEEIQSYYEQSICYICKKELTTRDHCHYTGKYRGTTHNVSYLRYETPKKIPVVFHIGSKYDYHFIIKELAGKFKGQFECLGENTEKYIFFQYQ